jgi:eukaryotic-like serine/threonine-protein kinase
MSGDIFSGELIGGGQEEFTNWRLGMYKVLRKIDTGGMGSVYLGVRADQEFKKYVAIKVIRKGMDTEDIISRFRRERQILASLDHPNIARLLDGGTTDDGLPYFVMEHVQGLPLTEYCDNRLLNIAQRLDLIRVVCSAVQYAHQNLVVHRDLKPANILVTADGVVKLLDFGIAKLLNPDLFELESPPTATNIRVMTPEYASPEQARSEPVTTASDVYSLGMVLYELLTGLRPFQFTTRNQIEVCRIICEQEPTKPSNAVTAKGNVDIEKFSTSRGVTSHRLAKQLHGDLDNIVLMALRKEPQLRYASAQALSEDIGRYMDGYTVYARHPTWRYRAGKYVRRHSVGVAASALILLLLVGSVVITLVQNAAISRQRDAAEQEKQKAEQVTKLLVNLFEVNDPAQAKGETITAREILDRGAQRVSKQLQNKPDVQAELMRTMGTIYEKLGLYDQAQSLLEKVVQIRKTARNIEDTELATDLRNLASVLHAKGRLPEAERINREALAIHRRARGNEHADVATDLILLAEVLQAKGQFGEAEICSREALAIHKKLLGNEHSDTANDLIILGRSLHNQGRLQEAEKSFREALAIHRKTLGNVHPNVGLGLNQLGLLLWEMGQLEEAEKILTESLILTRKLLGNEHMDTASSLNNLALVLDDSGKEEEAERLYRQALEIYRKSLGNEHPTVATGIHNVAGVLMDRGKVEEAEQLFREEIDIARKTLGDEHPDTADAMRSLASVLQEKGQLQEAERLYRQALEIFRSKLGNQHPYVALCMTNLAGIFLARNHISGAVSLLNDVLAFPTDKLPEDSRNRARAKSVMGECLIQKHKYQEAETLLLEAYAVLSIKEKGGRSLQKTSRQILNLYNAWGKPEKAEEFRLKTSS